MDSSIPATVPALTEPQTLGALFSAHPEEVIYESASDTPADTSTNESAPAVQSLFH